MRIWIDIVNSPHVLFFHPIIEELNSRGHSVYVTAREYAQTIGLLDEFKIKCTLIGAHAGANIVRKVVDVFKRGMKLQTYAKDKKFDQAITFNSPSLALAAKMLRIPSMVFMDYEYQPLNHLTFRLCDRVVTPAIFPDDSLSRLGASHKVVKYNGLKEQVYLSDFEPQHNVLHQLEIDEKRIIVIARPPATMALYHQFENAFFYEAVKYLLKNKDIVVIALPRSEAQRETLGLIESSRLIIPEKAVDGRSLIYFSDIVLSAGGTMNREAAVLGVPAYTVFLGKIGAVDKYLIDLGRIRLIKNFEDIEKIPLQKKVKKNALRDHSTKRQILKYILLSTNF